MPVCKLNPQFCMDTISALSNGQGVSIDSGEALAVNSGDCTSYIPLEDVAQIMASCDVANASISDIVPARSSLFRAFGTISLASEIRRYGPITKRNNVALSRADEDRLIADAYNMGWTAEKVRYLATRLLLTPHSHFSVVAFDDLQFGICIVNQPDKIGLGTAELETFYKLNIPVHVDETDLVPEKLQVMADHERIHAYADAKMWPRIKSTIIKNYGSTVTETTPQSFGQVFLYLLAKDIFDRGVAHLSYDGLKELLPNPPIPREKIEAIGAMPFDTWAQDYLANPQIPAMVRSLLMEMQVYGVHAKISETARRTMANRSVSYLEMFKMDDPYYGMIVFAFASVCHKISGETTDFTPIFERWKEDLRQSYKSNDQNTVYNAINEATLFLLWKQIFELAANSLDAKTVADHLGLTY